MSDAPVRITIAGTGYRVDMRGAVACARDLDFGGPHPRAFGAEAASVQPMRSGSFVGSIEAGGTVNASVVRMTPHGNGTHTESVAHIATAGLPVVRIAPLHPVPATVRTIAGEGMVTRETLAAALHDVPPPFREALVLRTAVDTALSEDAASLLVEAGVRHVVVSWPSIDPPDDGGRLAAHRAFWRVDGDRIGRPDATVTELAHIPRTLADGLYLLVLQMPAWQLDAVPSRPVLFPLVPDPEDDPS